MRIGLDARALSGRLTGDRTYWRGLISGLAEIDSTNQYSLFVRLPLTDVDRMSLPANFNFVVVTAPSERIWSLFAFAAALKRNNIDIAHVQYTLSPFIRCKTVTTIHDISFRLFPRLFSFKDRMLLNYSIPLSIRFASAIITVSENSRKDILAEFPSTPSGKITATPLAVGPAFKPLDPDEVVAAKKLISERYGLDGEYALSVGVLQPRKNLPLLIEAFVRAKRQAGFTLKLAIVGKVGWLSADTLAAISLAGDAVQMLGYVPDADLPLLYGCANIMAYPSTYEGFGLPALEAMACGCPVMAGNNSSLPEVVGEAGMLLPADSLTSWREAFVSLAENASERSKMRIRGLARASTFSWEETARRTLEVYRSVSTKE